MDKIKVKRFVNAFFGNEFTENGKKLFSAWMSSETDVEEKDEAMKDLWEKSAEAEISSSTYSDWNILRNRISVNSFIKAEKPRRKTINLYTWGKYAAVALITLSFAAILHFMDKRTVLHDNVNFNECFVADGEKRNLTLPDGTIVEVGAGTVLLYPESFENLNERSVYLKGEAYFDVAKMKEKPFIVKTSQLDVQALGTCFTVEALDYSKEIKTTLEEGSIQIGIKNSGEQPFILTPGEQMVFNSENRSVSISNVDIDIYKMKRSGFLVFENASLTYIVEELKRKFGVNIQCNTERFSNGRYNIKFTPQESITDALKVMEKLIGIKWEKGTDVIYIK